MKLIPLLPLAAQGLIVFAILALSLQLSRAQRKRVRRALWTQHGVFRKINIELAARRGLF